jgi:hypothetical protein
VARDALIAMLNQAEVLDVHPCLCTKITVLLPCCKDTGYPVHNQEIIPVIEDAPRKSPILMHEVTQ